MFASDRTADQLQMFLLLNSAAGLSGVCISPRLPDTHHYHSTLRCLLVLLTAEKLLPNTGMRNCLMCCFKDKQLFLKNRSDIIWGGNVGVPELSVSGLKSLGLITLQVSGVGPSGHFLPAAHALSWAWLDPEALTALHVQQLCWLSLNIMHEHEGINLTSMKRFSFCHCVLPLSFKWTLRVSPKHHVILYYFSEQRAGLPSRLLTVLSHSLFLVTFT